MVHTNEMLVGPAGFLGSQVPLQSPWPSVQHSLPTPGLPPQAAPSDGRESPAAPDLLRPSHKPSRVAGPDSPQQGFSAARSPAVATPLEKQEALIGGHSEIGRADWPVLATPQPDSPSPVWLPHGASSDPPRERVTCAIGLDIVPLEPQQSPV